MARTATEIRNQIFTAWMNNSILAALYGFNIGDSFELTYSNVSLEAQLIEVITRIFLTFEQLFDTHKAEVDEIIAQKLPHTPRWYRSKSLAFLYGFDLIPDTDTFDTSAATQQQIEQARIIKYAAVPKNASGGIVLIKIAGENNQEPAPISQQQQQAFEYYMTEIKDAGVRFTVINIPADLLQLTLTIYRDPLVIDENGLNILSGEAVVENAITTYLKQLPFDGELVLAKLVDALQQVPGVVIPHLVNTTTRQWNQSLENYEPAQPLNVRTVPRAGYFKIENFTGISYVV